MQLLIIIRILGILLMVFGLTFIPPWFVGWVMGDADLSPFVLSFALSVGLGGVLWGLTRHYRRELKLRDGLLIVVSFWVVLGLIGATPIYLQPELGLSFSQAVFESVSGITTTGATVITGLDDLPRSLLFYRQQLQWLGGLGIIVLVVAFLPLLGVGGMQLYKGEMTGPIKDTRLSGRISETAKVLWLVYTGITVLCALIYKIQGMTWFDAVGHAFSTVATGGFSTHDASFGHFENGTMEVTAMVFMILGALPMALHFVALRHGSLRAYWGSAEVRFFLGWMAAVAAMVVVFFLVNLPEGSWVDMVRRHLFNLVSFATTTGYTATDHTAFGPFLMLLLVMTTIIGGCAGSTTGGMKSVRVMLLARQGINEVRRLVHPHAVFVVRLGGRPLDPGVISAVWAFFAAWMFTFLVLFFAMLMTGMDIESALGAVIATLANLGPGVGSVASNFASESTTVLWLGMIGMIMGRLEIFTVLAVLL
ncbi:TrkH family potassium uptake protein, partial [Guyparkeria sp.]|uniref:TrkH family potassium uptake protein n=1 Tax=Guyparkeria sp. TaxID=2035736 RepID=UPI003568204F